jgi:hypothetical protein
MKNLGIIFALITSARFSAATTPIPLTAEATEKLFERGTFELRINENCGDRMKCFMTRDHALRVDISETRSEVYVCYDCRHQPPFLMYRQKIGQHLAEILRNNHELLETRFAKSCSMRIGFRKNKDGYSMSLDNLEPNPRNCREIKKQ